MKILKIKSKACFEIKNRGLVFAVETLPESFYEEYYDPSQLINKEVDINGKVFVVAGVEKFMIGGISPQHPYRLSCGILVK